MSTTLPHGIIQINEGNIAWYGDITSNWQLIDSKIGIYDAAIASIPAPANNGTLTINYGGTTIAMFGADDAGNVSADIPAPGDGTLTVTQGGSTLGSFTANQAAAGTIDIPAPGNGTLTIAQGGSTLGSFSANQGTNSVIAIPEPGAGVLTVTVDGITAGTFSANQATDETVNIEVPTKTSDLTNDSGFLTSADALPIGSYIQFAGSQAPAGFLVCNGGAISRTTYSQLFAVIGTTYGSGDGSTTFNLPNLIDRFLQGSTTSGTVKNAGLPNIEGNIISVIRGDKVISGALSIHSMGSQKTDLSGSTFVPEGYIIDADIRFNANHSNKIYGNSTTVQPPALTCLICIKY